MAPSITGMRKYDDGLTHLLHWAALVGHSWASFMQAHCDSSPMPVVWAATVPAALLCTSLWSLKLLLLLLLMMVFTPSRHWVHLPVWLFLGCVKRVDRGSGSVVPNISIRACSVPGQSRQCSIVCGTSPHLGQLQLTEASSRCVYTLRCMLRPDLSCASSVALFLESAAHQSLDSL